MDAWLPVGVYLTPMQHGILGFLASASETQVEVRAFPRVVVRGTTFRSHAHDEQRKASMRFCSARCVGCVQSYVDGVNIRYIYNV
jgi:hypothetical protein